MWLDLSCMYLACNFGSMQLCINLSNPMLLVQVGISQNPHNCFFARFLAHWRNKILGHLQCHVDHHPYLTTVPNAKICTRKLPMWIAKISSSSISSPNGQQDPHSETENAQVYQINIFKNSFCGFMGFVSQNRVQTTRKVSSMHNTIFKIRNLIFLVLCTNFLDPDHE